MPSPFFPPALWEQSLWLAAFLVVWQLGRRNPFSWRVNAVLLLIAAAPVAVAVGWYLWFLKTLGSSGYTGLVDPYVIEQLQEASVLHAIFLSGAMLVLFLVRGIILIRRKAAAEAAEAARD